MKKARFLFGIIILLFCFNFISAADEAEPLLYQSNLVYEGAFRVPSGNPGATYGFDYVTSGFVFNPNGNNGKGSLFINNHVYEQYTAEITIPNASKNINSLNTASFLQNFYDITEGHMSNLGDGGTVVSTNGVVIGGLMVYNNKLIGSVYGYFDAGYICKLSHFTSGLTLSQTGDFNGMYQVGSMSQSGFVAGNMVQIPSEWQSQLGGPALTGLSGDIPIIRRTSYGPSAFVFNPDDIGVKNPIPATPVLYYDSSHPTLGTWGQGPANPTGFTFGSNIGGIVFPPGTRTILFIGGNGQGAQCYGTGGESGGDCYDPVNIYKGDHAYPYVYRIWAYDVNDFIKVKNGSKNPWDITPYATWELDLSLNGNIDPSQATIQGVAYDPTTKKLYISQKNANQFVPGTSTDDRKPLIQVFTINITTFGCNENWNCSSWSSCISNSQTRTCTDLNSCGTTVNLPALTQSCATSPNVTTMQKLLNSFDDFKSGNSILSEYIGKIKSFILG
jgi:hypothetical protein